MTKGEFSQIVLIIKNLNFIIQIETLRSRFNQERTKIAISFTMK